MIKVKPTKFERVLSKVLLAKRMRYEEAFKKERKRGKERMKHVVEKAVITKLLINLKSFM